MVAALCCELEGVLVDSRTARREALAQALARYGIDPSAECATGDRRDVRAAALALAPQLANDPTLLDLVAGTASTNFSGRLAQGFALQPGALELMTALHGGVRLALVTRARRDDADAVLRLCGLDAAFEVRVAAEDVLDAKPAPECFQRAVERLAARRTLAGQPVVALEDGLAGIRAAHAAGLVCFAVGDVPIEEAIEADAYLPTLVGQTLSTLDIAARSTALGGRER